MIKIFFALMLVSICGNAGAGWVYVTETEKSIIIKDVFIAYADPATIRKTSNRVKMWSLYDYKLPQKSGVISVRQKNEYKSGKWKAFSQDSRCWFSFSIYNRSICYSDARAH